MISHIIRIVLLIISENILEKKKTIRIIIRIAEESNMDKVFDIKDVLIKITTEIDKVIERKRTRKFFAKYSKADFFINHDLICDFPISRDTYYKYKAYVNSDKSKKKNKNQNIQSIDLRSFFDICMYTDVSADYLLGFNKTKRKESSAEWACEEFGLSDEALRTLAVIRSNEKSCGKNNMLLGELSSEIINLILENTTFWNDFNERLQCYLSCQFDGRLSDIDIDTARYNLMRTFEKLTDDLCDKLIKQKANLAELDTSSPLGDLK